MKKTETEQILEYLKHVDESINGPRPKAQPPKKEPPLSKRVSPLDEKVDGLDKKVDGLDKKVAGLDKKVEGLDKRVEGLDKKVGSLGQKVDKLDTRVSEVQLGLAALAAGTKAQFQKVDERFQTIDVQFQKVGERFQTINAQFQKVDARFGKVNRSIETARVQLVGFVELVHNELTGRIVNLEGPGTADEGRRERIRRQRRAPGVLTRSPLWRCAAARSGERLGEPAAAAVGQEPLGVGANHVPGHEHDYPAISGCCARIARGARCRPCAAFSGR